MNDTLIQRRQVLIEEINKYFPEILGKIVKLEHEEEVTLGTIVRVQDSKGIWYDIPHTMTYTITNEELNKDLYLFKVYQMFNKSAYSTMKVYIPTSTSDIKSIYQITEEERIKNLIINLWK